MMFRSTQADEESGSDWDDYSPAPTPQDQSTSPHQPLPRAYNLTTAAAHTPSHIPTGSKHSPHDAVHKPQQSQVVRLYDDQARQSVPDRNIKPLDTELTCLSTVSSPQSPAHRTTKVPTKQAELYRANEEENSGNYVLEPSSSMGDCNQLLQPHHCVRADRGGGGENRAMEFSHVDAQSSEILSPSYESSYSYMGNVADKSEEYAKRCVEEVFSTLRVGSDFLIVFLLGCCHYLMDSVTRKLCCGLAHICTDSLFKPLVHVCFNGCCWPTLSMCRHICHGVVIALSPPLELIGKLTDMAVKLAAACRLVQVNIQHKQHSNA